MQTEMEKKLWETRENLLNRLSENAAALAYCRTRDMLRSYPAGPNTKEGIREYLEKTFRDCNEV